MKYDEPNQLSAEDRLYLQHLKEALSKFVEITSKGTFNQATNSKIERLRAHFIPAQDDEFFSYVSESGAVYGGSGASELLNPTPYEVVKYSTAGFLSYHHTPYDMFFKSHLIPYQNLNVEEAREAIQYWYQRDLRTHAILQQGHNLLQEALFTMERLVFNLGCKTLDIDENLNVRKTHHPIENIMAFSSDKLNRDILGVKENLSWFQFKTRFPKPFMQPEQHKEIESAFDFTRVSDVRLPGVSADISVYRYNLSVSVFKMFMTSYLSYYPESKKRFEETFRSEFSLRKNDIVDMTLLSDGTIVFIRSAPYRTIIVGNLGGVYKDGVRGKAQGDVALSRSIALQEAEVIGYQAFERAFGTMFLANSDLEGKIFDSLSSDDILYVDNDTDFKPLNIQIDIATAYTIIDRWEQKIREQFFLDIFTLIEKNRMPVQEINIRRSDGFKQLGLYVVSDMATNLEPEVLSVMQMDAEKNSLPEPPPHTQGSLRVVYVSPVMQAIKSTVLDDTMRTLGVFQTMDALKPGVTMENVDFNHLSNKVLDKTNNADIALSSELRKVMQDQRRMQEELAQREAMVKLKTASDERLKGLEEGGGAGQPSPGPASPGVQG